MNVLMKRFEKDNVNLVDFDYLHLKNGNFLIYSFIYSASGSSDGSLYLEVYSPKKIHLISSKMFDNVQNQCLKVQLVNNDYIYVFYFEENDTTYKFEVYDLYLNIEQKFLLITKYFMNMLTLDFVVSKKGDEAIFKRTIFDNFFGIYVSSLFAYSLKQKSKVPIIKNKRMHIYLDNRESLKLIAMNQDYLYFICDETRAFLKFVCRADDNVAKIIELEIGLNHIFFNCDQDFLVIFSFAKKLVRIFNVSGEKMYEKNLCDIQNFLTRRYDNTKYFMPFIRNGSLYEITKPSKR
jgi:hypothetical protein